MVLTGKQLQDLIDKYDADARKNERNYMETGMSRYQTAWHKAEDLVDTLRAAQNAVEEHNKLLHYRSQISMLAAQARRCDDPGAAGPLLDWIISLAVSDGLIQKED